MANTAIAALAIMAMLVGAARLWWVPQARQRLLKPLRRAWWKPAQKVEASVAHIQPGDTLVIVDMQRGFLNMIPRRFRKQAIANVLAEIKAAIAINAPIVLLELPRSDFGPTIKPIGRALQGYSLCFRVTKVIDNGGLEVRDLCAASQIKSTSFRVCGMNTDMCVYQTAATLNSYGSAQVVVDACLTTSSAYDWCEYVEYYSSRHIRRVRQTPDPSRHADTRSSQWLPNST